MAIPMLKIRRPNGRLIFNMGIAIPSKTVFLIETAPWVPYGVQELPTCMYKDCCGVPILFKPYITSPEPDQYCHEIKIQSL